MKLHCLWPLPPPDPAPARPLPGIWLGGGGGFQPGNRPRIPPFHFHPREGLPHLSLSPLLPPTAAWENSCLHFCPESDRAVGAAAFPPPCRDAEGLSVATTDIQTSRGGPQAPARAGKEKGVLRNGPDPWPQL